MKAKRVTGMLLASALAVSLFTGCGSGSSENEGGTKEFTAFYAVPGAEINDDNEIQQIIAEKTGVKVDETWLTGQTASEAVGTLIAGGDYPDFIDGGDAMGQLYEAGALVPLDDYLDDYPNIKAYYTDEEWNKLRRMMVIFTGFSSFRMLREKRRLRRIMMKPFGFRQEYWSGQDILK